MPGKKVVKVYLSPQLQRILVELSTPLGLNESEVLRLGLLMLVEKHGVQARG